MPFTVENGLWKTFVSTLKEHKAKRLVRKSRTNGIRSKWQAVYIYIYIYRERERERERESFCLFN